MNIHHHGLLSQPSGTPVKRVEQVVYLGSLLTACASAGPEVSRRLGEARCSFKALTKCWSHANVTLHWKVELYTSCIVSKLLYGLEALWLLQADVQRIDAFHCRCLRSICRIQPSYFSRVPNAFILHKTSQTPLSTTLAERQDKLYGYIVNLPDHALLRRCTLEPGSDRPRQWNLKRRRGRPKLQWAFSIYKRRLGAAFSLG